MNRLRSVSASETSQMVDRSFRRHKVRIYIYPLITNLPFIEIFYIFAG